MPKTKNKKQTLWIYAVVLFMSAIIVLMITTFSQIKSSSNVQYYKQESTKNEKEKNKFKTTLSEAIKKGETLTTENEKLKKENETIKKENETIKKDEKFLTGKDSDAAKSFEALLDAESLYDDNKINEAAETLNKNVKYNLLGSSGKKAHDNLKKFTFGRASYSFYSSGIGNMDSKEYEKARDFFKRSYDLEQKNDISDDCLYYLGFCENKLGNYEKSISHLTTLLKEFPETNFKNDAESINVENKSKQKKPD